MAGQEKTLCLLYCYKGENKENNMSIHSETRKYEVVVVGGGLAGVCAAIAAARKGARTAIIQNRSMFGGNASSEIRMHIVGANSHGAKKNLGETGILLEILLANKRRNPYASFPVFDSVIWEKVHFQENLESFLNTNMDDVILEGKKIKDEQAGRLPHFQSSMLLHYLSSENC